MKKDKKTELQSKIEQLLQKLRKELKLQYPEHHWNHLNIFSKYWDLREAIHKK